MSADAFHDLLKAADYGGQYLLQAGRLVGRGSQELQVAEKGVRGGEGG